MRKNSNQVQLIIEPYPDNYNGYEFITLIRYNDENYLNIVDNIINKTVQSYVLDFCQSSSVREDLIIDVARNWYESKNYIKHPLSIEMSRLGINEYASPILRNFPLDFITRVIGPLPEYPMSGAIKLRRRKRKSIPSYMEFVDKRFTDQIEV